MPHRRRRAALVAAIACTSLSSITGVSADEAASRIANSPLYAIGVVTPDIQKTLQNYQRVMGVVPQQMGETHIEEPDGAKVTAKMAVVLLPNFFIKIFEPVSQNGPYAAHLRQYGLSIQDMQFFVDADIQAVRAHWEQKGGKWTLGSPQDAWAYLDFTEALGCSLEPIRMRTLKDAPVTVAADTTVPALGSMPVTRVGIAVTDAHEAARAYSNVFGIPIPEVTEDRDPQYPPGTHANASARLRIAQWQQGDIGMELIQSVGGPTPWSEYTQRQKANAAYSITIEVGTQLDEVAHDLQQKGGRWVFGKPGGDFAGFDFTDTLGLAIQITGSSKAGPRSIPQSGQAARSRHPRP